VVGQRLMQTAAAAAAAAGTNVKCF
jgi:hypothetical protein